MHFSKTVSLLLACPLAALADTAPTTAESEAGPVVRFDAPEDATASIILLHGLTNTWEVFKGFPEEYQTQDRFKHINFVFPNSPIRDTPFVQDFFGEERLTHSWFNQSLTGIPGGFDEVQYWETVDYIEKLILNETAHGISADRIIVGGFSQGGMVSFGALASIKTKIGGWLFYASLMPNLSEFEEHLGTTNLKTPVFHGHGLNDTVLPVQNATRTADLFKEKGFNYTLTTYNGMIHQPDFEKNDKDAEEWVAKVIPKEFVAAPANDASQKVLKAPAEAEKAKDAPKKSFKWWKKDL